MLKPDTVVAGTTARAVTATMFDSLGQPAVGKFLRFGTFGLVPDSVQADATGAISTTWTPPDSAGTYTLVGVRGTLLPMLTAADSAGRVVHSSQRRREGWSPECDEDDRRDQRHHHRCQRQRNRDRDGEGSVQQQSEDRRGHRLRSR